MPSSPPAIRRRLSPDSLMLDVAMRRRPTPPGLLANPGAQRYVYVFTPTVGGTAPSRPKFTITFGSPGSTNYGISQVQLVNDSQSPDQVLSVTRAFSPGEQLIVDSDLYTVQVNGAALASVEFSGQFITLDPRLGTTNTVYLYVWATRVPTLTPQLDWNSRYLS